MHPNPSFRSETENQNLAFARERGFGSLSVNASNGPLVAHIPFVISPDATFLELHLVRSNPILKLLDEPMAAVLAVIGGDGYISPDWYGVEDQVPTWNYIAVHIRGTLTRLDANELHPLLSRLSDNMESRLSPKKRWTSDKMDQGVYERMQRQIVPLKMNIESIEGTWKLSQNKSDEARLSAADALAENGFGIEIAALARLMRNV